MPISEAKKKSNAAYNRRQDNIMLRPTKEDGARIRKAAADAGKSVQRFCLDLVLPHWGCVVLRFDKMQNFIKSKNEV